MEDQATKMEEQKNKRVHRLSRKKRRRIEMLAEMEEDRREVRTSSNPYHRPLLNPNQHLPNTYQVPFVTAHAMSHLVHAIYARTYYTRIDMFEHNPGDTAPSFFHGREPMRETLMQNTFQFKYGAFVVVRST
jgi:hypothetical protein